MAVLSVSSFGGGTVLEGSSDVQKTDELRACDGYDLSARGQLVAASDLSLFANAVSAGAALLSPVFGMALGASQQSPIMAFVGNDSGNIILAVSLVDGTALGRSTVATALAKGVVITSAAFPYVDETGAQRRLLLVNIGARPADNPIDAPGLQVITYSGASYSIHPISQNDALGTGSGGEFTGGTHGVQLRPRFIVAYNNFLFAAGFDNRDATTADAPNRLMFCNVGNPLKWGNDPLPPPDNAETNRAFADTDAFTIGGAGETLRAGCVWAGKLWIGTSGGMHYVEGFGRESFLTNGAVPFMGSRNVIGPHAMIEGPDRLLYGIDDAGLWVFDGTLTDPVGNKLRDYATHSPGFWDLIWTDTSRTLATYPGQTNQDLVWMLSDTLLRQVWVVIPYCSITNGYGYGTDSVIVKYHVDTGGFTRQKFPGKILSHGAVFTREQTADRQRFVTVSGGTTNIQRYGYKANGSSSPVLCNPLPDVTMGEYAPHGVDGVGVARKVYLTLSWESASSLPLVFTVTPSIDGEAVASPVTVTIGASAPGTPSDGDVWLDTSGTDTNIGNGTAGSLVPAHAADFLLKQYVTSWTKWRATGEGGQQGTRATIPVAFVAGRGTRTKYRLTCTTAGGRYQVEGLGLEPATIRAAE